MRDVRFLHYPDGMMDNTMDLRRQLCELIRQVKPDILLTIDPWRPYQLHPDHRAAGQAALDAAWAAREWYLFPEQLVDHEPWRIKEIYLFWTGDADYWEDVSDSIDRRVEALKRHDSQVNGRIAQIEERIRKMAAEVGSAHGCQYAEAFRRIKL